MAWRITVAALASLPLQLAPVMAQDLQAGIAHYEAGRFAEAKRALLAAHNTTAGDGTAAFFLGRIAIHDSAYSEAGEWCERAIKADDKQARFHVCLGEALGEQARKANVFRQGLMARRVKGEFERAAELDPKNVDAHEGLFDFYREAPGMLGGSTDRAIAEGEILRKLSPALGAAKLASLYEQRKRLPEAERILTETLATDNDSLEVHKRLLVFYVSHQAFERAASIATKILERRPDHRMALLQMGLIGAEHGVEVERAEAALKAFLALPPISGYGPGTGYPITHYRLGLIYEQRKDLVHARAEFGEALKLSPDLAPAKQAMQRVAP